MNNRIEKVGNNMFPTILEQIRQANAKMAKELEDFPAQEEEAVILVNGYIKFSAPINVSEWTNYSGTHCWEIAEGSVTIHPINIKSIEFIPGHGV